MSANYPSIGNLSSSRFCYVEAWNGALKLHNQTNQSMHWIATIQYTKIADVAGSGIYTPSGALAVHYSTNEQVIGTWIDGKPLYEKTWDFSGSPVSLVYNAWVDSGIEASTNIDTLVNSVLRYGALTCMAVEVGKGAGGFTVGLNKLENLNTRGVTQITLQYTKTTD
jgi:hypothetical protein